MFNIFAESGEILFGMSLILQDGKRIIYHFAYEYIDIDETLGK